MKWQEYTAGCVAGAANVVSGFPFDTVKVRLQASPDRYRGPWDCVRRIWRHEGPRALFRGMSPPLVGGAFETGINYAVYSAALRSLSPATNVPPSLYHVGAAAAVSGVALSVVLSPVELIKCRLQLGSYDKQFHRHKGPLDVLRSVVAEEGVRGLSRGMGGTMAREIPGNAIYFMVYHGLRRRVDAAVGMDEQHGVLRNVYEATAAVTCGGLAGVVMWSLVFPLDAAKTRIQTTRPGSADDVGLARQLQRMWARGGVRGVYGGLAPTLLRAFPANACQWLAWEFAMNILP